MNDNPWLVESIQAFNCLKCPECAFNAKLEDNFKDHALKNHPLSFVLFDKRNKKKGSKWLEKSSKNDRRYCTLRQGLLEKWTENSN